VLKVKKTKEKTENEEKPNRLLPKRKQFSFQDRRENYFEYSFRFKFQKKNQIHPKKTRKKRAKLPVQVPSELNKKAKRSYF